MSRRRLFPKKIHPLVAGVIILFVLAGQLWGWWDTPQEQTASPEPTTTSSSYKVSRFIDGDTFAIDDNGANRTVRIIGIDTPETQAPGRPVQCYGPAASAHLKTLIGEQTVTLKTDPQNDDRDRYGRLLRHVYLPDGTSVAETTIRNGYGFAYIVYPFNRQDTYVAAEAQARTEAKGLWSNCTVTEQNGRKQTVPLQ